MNVKLPEKFVESIKALLTEEEAEKFFQSYETERVYGIRVNTLKADPSEFSGLTENIIELQGNVPWCENGFYYANGQPGKSALYHAGVYYIQEPSAMFPASNLEIEPGDAVLDICAAPGGKSTQTAAKLQGEGLLVSNDISEERAKALVKNIQMAGVKNAIVLNETPAVLEKSFQGFFDKIIVDAPCSGEGMFRKDEEAVKSWESFKNQRCREMQDEILESVDKMLKPGGMISYSTCTFSPIENEQTIEAFIKLHPEYELVETMKVGGICDALPSCVEDNSIHIERAARLWPQNVKGEGHFTAVLKKAKGEAEGDAADISEYSKKKKSKIHTKHPSYKLHNIAPIELRDFFEENMTCEVSEGKFYTMGKNLYYLPVEPPCLDNMKVMMAGAYLGTLEYAQFKPSHPFSLMYEAKDFNLRIEMDIDNPKIDSYLKGETLVADETTEVYAYGEKISTENLYGAKGICCVCVKKAGREFVLGLGNISAGTVKNLYPKGWRRFC